MSDRVGLGEAMVAGAGLIGLLHGRIGGRHQGRFDNALVGNSYTFRQNLPLRHGSDRWEAPGQEARCGWGGFDRYMVDFPVEIGKTRPYRHLIPSSTHSPVPGLAEGFPCS